jgi:hypothetical protein
MYGVRRLFIGIVISQSGPLRRPLCNPLSQQTNTVAESPSKVRSEYRSIRGASALGRGEFIMANNQQSQIAVHDSGRCAWRTLAELHDQRIGTHCDHPNVGAIFGGP